MLVFTEEWIQDLHRRYDQQPIYQRPFVYFLATLDVWEDRRLQIEQWVANVPPANQKSIISRLRNDVNHAEAYNELAIGESLRVLGYELQYEPRIGDQTPDYLVKGRDKVPDFIVEAVSVRASKEQQENTRRSSWVMYAIHKIPINAKLEIHRLANNEYPKGREVEAMAKTVRKWLEDSNTKVNDQIEVSGLRFELLGYQENAPHTLCIGPYESFVVSHESLRRNIRNKLSKYAPVVMHEQMPFVVAVVADFHTGLGVDNMIDVLIGREVIRMYTDEQGNIWSEPDRKQDGVFVKASNKTALTPGLLVTTHRDGTFGHDAIFNPVAAYPLPAETFLGENGNISFIETKDA